jgi:hypothetical protein
MIALTLSKAVEHARGCVATKIGLLDIIFPSTQVNIRKAFHRTVYISSRARRSLIDYIPSQNTNFNKVQFRCQSILSVSDVKFGMSPRDIANVPGLVYRPQALPHRRKTPRGQSSKRLVCQ